MSRRIRKFHYVCVRLKGDRVHPKEEPRHIAFPKTLIFPKPTTFRSTTESFGLLESIEKYVSNVLEFLTEYWDVLADDLPIAISSQKEKDLEIIPETYEYHWLVDRNCNLYGLNKQGDITHDLTAVLIDDLEDNIRRNRQVVEVSEIFRDSKFARELKIQEKMLRLVETKGVRR